MINLAEKASLPPGLGLDVEDGEITEDDTVLAPTVSPVENNPAPSTPIQADADAAAANGVSPTAANAHGVLQAHPAGTEPLQPQEIARAKDIVLDLLGWGVTPEYLVDAGVSSAALYAIFKDLNLRLPSNLDMPAANNVVPAALPITEKGALEQKAAVLPPKLARP
ncbi:hypothetical protein FIBSPDRAFT_866331 [Athelia psychrophila]|uniref:Uncharacterized protein n=1 Tax=Athelia psychrophila TaxID=1759441 RepID=A0A166ETN7_9AGAM|nr:hypothetical protein FIBSPDRAFT_866331 [Fibularhizoctonia sp. CBS 109695]